MSRIAKNDVNAALDIALKNIKDAAGADGITSRADLKTKLATIASPTERALTDRFFRFMDHRDAAPNARITSPDVDSTGAYAKEHLLEKYDLNHNGYDKSEIARMSLTGQLAVKLAAERKGVTIHVDPPPASALGRTITAVAKDCDYMSETDSTPAYVEHAMTSPVDVMAMFPDLLHKTFDFDGTGVDLGTYTTEKQPDALAFLNDMAQVADPNDDGFSVKNAAAWQKLGDALKANLTDLQLYKVGPKDDQGNLATDNGAYELFLVGKTADGKLAGVAFESVET